MMTNQDLAFAGSVAMIRNFLKDQEMNETLDCFERELSKTIKGSDNNTEFPSILQLAQGFLDLKVQKDAIVSREAEARIEFPVMGNSIKCTAAVVASACSDSLLAVSSTDRMVRIYDINEGLPNDPIQEFKQDQVVLSMAIANNLLLMTGMAGKTRLIDITTTKEISEMKDHTKYVSCCGFSSDGRKIFTGSHDGCFNVYSIENLDNIQLCHSKKVKGPIESCCVIKDVVYVAVRGDCFLHLIDLHGFKSVGKNMNSNGDDWVSFTALHVSQSVDGSHLLILTDTPSGRFLIFDIEKWQKVADIWGGLSIDRFSHPRGIWIDSKHFMIGDDDGNLSLWNINEAKHTEIVQATQSAIRSFSKFGTNLFVGSFDQTVTLWKFRKDI